MGPGTPQLLTTRQRDAAPQISFAEGLPGKAGAKGAGLSSCPGLRRHPAPQQERRQGVQDGNEDIARRPPGNDEVEDHQRQRTRCGKCEHHGQDPEDPRRIQPGTAPRTARAVITRSRLSHALTLLRKGMLAGLAPIGASAGAAGCWVQGCPSQGSGPLWPCLVYDVFWLLSFGF